ncbi:hypothetical protein [Fluviicola taffensis]|uniref:Prokaryotic RING finger family 4 n=1 Tax=Fluviicola taffensis (strain DSM 16823 / NCIMB 13979 / RW262) TaxID=755732 RepID=F2IGF4_FLUTR|nr:hypothetical protein [Fluviicola taffensis]AEA42560.1 hypothetical protein Fluta_0555 [Fluviicola taffensis DSM 16823]
MKTDLLKVSIRKNAIVIPQEWIVSDGAKHINETTSVLLANCSKLGYTFSEDLLNKVNRISPKTQLELFELLKEVTGVNKNWTPLVKQWNVPTGESVVDHIITWFANVFQTNKGTKLPCGHLIPNNTFPIERYNGCPFCGTPFEFDKLDYTSGGNKLKTLELWTEDDLKKYLMSLLESPVALDATQVDDLKVLITHFDIPSGVEVRIKETLMVVIDVLVEQDHSELAGQFFKTPNDILRYLWYNHTGFLQIIEPKTIVNRLEKNAKNVHPQLDKSMETKIKSLADLKLKYTRSECQRYATWLNNLTLDIVDQCEMMHPKRSIWVRVIRALRLAEYSKRKGFENLAELLDTFYNEKYEVWQGKVNEHKLKSDAEVTFALLKQRPGLFARSLFSSMLWFGPDVSIKHFKEVMGKVPARLIFTLNMYAEVYFDKSSSRTVKPLGGTSKNIPSNKLLQLYTDQELKRMQSLVQSLSLEVIKSNLSKVENTNSTMYIDKGLFNIPIAIGDRSEHLQDLPGALMGTRFKVEGDIVRLFLQWGEGLPAQHLDMDLSCRVVYEKKNEFCSYSQLVIPGCKHSGDIQSIPDKTGTAEYIDVDLNELTRLGAKYVSFTCNAYSNGSLAPNVVVGWMNSNSPMRISSSGVAYDPTAVQHQVRIKQSLTKGMVFGVLDVENREIVWLEMSFGGQVVQDFNLSTLVALLNKLDAKLKIGDLLNMKADVQGLAIIEDVEKADEVYDMSWALNTAEVSKLFLE